MSPENKRSPYCTREGLEDLTCAAGLVEIKSTPLEAPAVFKSFDDYWNPFTLGAGPAPGYCMNLEPDAREQLRGIPALVDRTGRIIRGETMAICFADSKTQENRGVKPNSSLSRLSFS